MKTSHAISLLVIIVVLGGTLLLLPKTSLAPQKGSTDFKNAAYSIDGQNVTLINGRAEATTAPGSASKTVTQYFGNDATGDLNADGIPDTAFLLTQTTGGSGTFYYVVVALKTSNGYEGTNAALLGDRIAPQTTEIQNGVLIVNYADRRADEPMTVAPSVGVSKYFTLVGTTLAETGGPSATDGGSPPTVPLGATVGAGEHCGGNTTHPNQCSAGYHCAPSPGSHLPFGDVGGICVPD